MNTPTINANPTLQEMLEANYSTNAFVITVIDAKGRIEQAECYNAEEVPDFLHCFSKQWPTFFIQKRERYSWQEIEKAKIAEEQELKAKEKKTLKLPKMEKKTTVIHKKLITQDWIDCTCVETGITVKIQATCNGVSKLPFVHPLSYEENIREIFSKYAKEGKSTEELPANILAGCFIAFLRSEDLLLCKNPIDVNKYLSNASQKKLSFILRWFLARRSFQDFPKLSLLDLHLHHDWYKPTSQKELPDAEIVLENYLRVCQGEKVNGSHYIAIPEKKKTVKVFTDKVKQESKDYMEAQSDAKFYLQLIEKEFGGLSLAKPLLARIKTAITALSFLSESNKQKIAKDISETFSGFEPAAELAMIFRKTSTEAIQEDLLTFTQSMEQEQKQTLEHESKPQKVDFMSLLKVKKES